MSQNYGIDYGMGRTNKGADGIRFGVIPMHALHEWAHESFEDDFGEPTCPHCGAPAVEYDDDKHGEYPEIRGCCDFACEHCERIIDSSDAYSEESLGASLDDGEYKAQLGTDGDVFILSSPYYTHAQFCSPCAPGACYLLNPTDKGGPRCYCFGHDWFDKGKAPYPVFRVSDGALVRPGK
jgi:hypothetical protein